VKAIPVALLLTAAGIAAASCGSGTTDVRSITFTGSTTTTVANLDPGTLVRCGKAGAHVPTSGGVTANLDGSSSSTTLQVERLPSGSVRVVCERTR
jgi:hypothetical protein